GIETLVCFAIKALRMRVSISAIGSLTFMPAISCFLPTGLHHTGDVAFERQLAEADPAQLELADVAARAATALAAVPHADIELAALFPVGHALLRHVNSYLLACSVLRTVDFQALERHAQQAQQLPAFLVRLRRRDDGNLHSPDLVDLVILDLREEDLLAQAECVVAAPIKRVRGDAAEVARAGQRHVHQAVKEGPHALAAQRDLHAD